MMDWLAFKTPERLWVLLVLPALVIAYLVLMRLKGRTSLRFTNTGVLGRVIGSQRRWTRHLAVFMSLCSLVALTLAWAQPLGTEKVPRERATVVLVIDTSLSMQATDVEPNRLEAAKAAAQQFVDALPDSYNVALISLNGSPSMIMPPSTDRGALTRAISTLELKEGTAIGDALDQSLKAVSEAPAPDDGSEAAPAMIVMLSDGGNTTGTDPAESATRVQQAGVPVFTIAYGTENGYVDLDGERFNVAPDTNLLAQVASTSGGRALDASSSDELNTVYKDLSSDMGYETQKTEVTARWVLVSLMFGVVAAFGAVGMAARWS